jgi:hypothetical protein
MHHPHHGNFKPRFHHQHFYVAPFYSYYYPGWPLWYGGVYPFGYDYGWDVPYYPSEEYALRPSLPSQDMLSVSLPEGVLEPGGTVDGFLYFQRVPPGDAHLEMNLVDGSSGQQFGTITMPLVVLR